MLAMTLFHIGSFAVGIGNVLAAALSYGKNKSIILAALHGLLGWFYVVYRIIV